MSEQTNRGLAYDPNDLERLLVSRENVGDVDGIAVGPEEDFSAMILQMEKQAHLVGRGEEQSRMGGLRQKCFGRS